MLTAEKYEALKYVGSPIKRVEDPRLVTGKGTFLADITFPNMLYAKILRSTYAHARIKKVDTAKAIKLEGVSVALSGRDILKYCVPWSNHLALGINEVYYPLAVDKAFYAGQEIAIVAASSEAIAEDAIELIDVEYEPITPVINPEDSVKDDAPLIRDDIEGIGSNVSFRHKIVCGDIDKAFEEADALIDGRFVTRENHVAPMEPSAALASYDESTDRMTVWATHQTPSTLLKSISEALRMPENHIRIIVPDMGGGFGARVPPNPQYILPAILSKITKRPVRLVLDRREDLLASPHRNSSVAYMSMAVRKDGRILGLRTKILWDTGATHGFGSSNLVKGMVQVPGPYKIENILFEGMCVYTNKSVTGPSRGFGQPQLVFARERLIDKAARKLHLDPLEFRLRNVIEPKDIPYHSSAGPIFDSANFGASLREAAKAIGWDAIRKNKRPNVGIGIALYQKNNGGLHFNNIADYESIRIEISRDGSVKVFTSALPHGQGHETFISQIAADLLTVQLSDIRVIHGDTDMCPPGLGTWGSRTAVITGGALHKACSRIVEKMKAIAAYRLELDIQDLEFAEGLFRSKHAPARKMTFMDVVKLAYTRPDKLPPGMEPTLYSVATYDPPGKTDFDDKGRSNVASTYDVGAYAVAVKVDPETGEFSILDQALAYDCGKVINPMLVEGQHHGGLVQGFGMAMYENLCWDDQGQPLNPSFMDFLCVSSSQTGPKTRMIRLESLPFYIETGYRGIGESATIPVPAALANALSDAIGKEINELPLAPEQVLRDLNERRE